MTQSYFTILLIGGIAVLLFDALGSIASRKLDFSFRKLSILSLFLQLSITAYAAYQIDTMAAISIGGLIALIDAVLGYKITLSLDPKLSEEEKEALEIFAEDGKPKVPFVLMLVCTGLFLGWIGSIIARFL